MCVVCTNSKLPEYYFCCFHESKRCLVKGKPNLMAIIRRYVEEKNRQIYTSYRHFFDVISMSEKLTSFWHNLFDAITMTKKSTSFRRTFFDVISMAEKSTSFWHALFDTILMIKKSMPLRRTFFYLILMVKKLTLFRCIFDVILMEKWCKFDVLILICFWRQKVVVDLTYLFEKFLIYQKLKPLELYFWT